ncbi:MAG: hypothetical protein U0625_00130 [Phycisphaerales bacterium]
MNPRKKTPVRAKRTLQYPEGLLNPKDWLRFIQLRPFEEAWKAWELTDADLQALEMLVLCDPERYPVIPGLEGVRKCRFTSNKWTHGKSKGARIYYLYFPDRGIVFWMFAHMRSEDDPISAHGKQRIAALVKQMKSRLGAD